MNVFLPYRDYARSVACLDRARLNQQRSEVKAVYSMCLDKDFQNQPLVKMWKAHTWWLMEYGRLCSLEAIGRGINDHLLPFFLVEQSRMQKGAKPEWPESYHASVRANLLRKDEDFYRAFGWTEVPMEGYLWPVT